MPEYSRRFNDCALRIAHRRNFDAARRVLITVPLGRSAKIPATRSASVSEQTQNFSNHGKLVPAFHFFVIPVLLFNFFWSLYRCYIMQFAFPAIVYAFVAAALVVLMFLARLFALRVQDRVIRLEERLRLRELLPADLQPRIVEFRPSQLIALRFASDSELPALARKVLDNKIEDQKAIKSMVQNWRADYLRA
jgi:Family of unknown function (DUF6526)